MSYEILYDKQFVKINENDVIPIECHGSNNCTETTYSGRERRERHWGVSTYATKGKNIIDKNELIENVNQIINDNVSKRMMEPKEWGKPESGHYDAEHIRKNYGYFSSLQIPGGSTANNLLNWYKNGIKKALPIETLAEIGIVLRFTTYVSYYDKEPKDIEPLPDEYASTTDQIITILNKRKDYYKNTETGKGEYVTFSPSGQSLEMKLKRLRKIDRPKRERQNVSTNVFYTLCNDKGSLIKYTSRGYRYSYNNEGGKRYLTRKDAEKKLSQIVKNGRHNSNTWEVKEFIKDNPINIVI